MSFDEYAWFVQTASPEKGIANIIEKITDYRARRNANRGQLRKFDREESDRIARVLYPGVAKEQVKTKFKTLDDYADLSLRYLKATGLFKTKGRGISIDPIREELVQLIHDMSEEDSSEQEYLTNLWNGAKLPTDDIPAAIQVINDLISKINRRGETAAALIPDEDVSQKRLVLEEQLRHLDEKDYSRDQANKIDEILAWIEALSTGATHTINEEKITIPRGERPA